MSEIFKQKETYKPKDVEVKVDQASIESRPSPHYEPLERSTLDTIQPLTELGKEALKLARKKANSKQKILTHRADEHSVHHSHTPSQEDEYQPGELSS